MTRITYDGPLPLRLAVGDALVLATTRPPRPDTALAIRYDGTAASLRVDVAALGSPDTVTVLKSNTSASVGAIIPVPLLDAPTLHVGAVIRPPNVTAAPSTAPAPLSAGRFRP